MGLFDRFKRVKHGGEVVGPMLSEQKTTEKSWVNDEGNFCFSSDGERIVVAECTPEGLVFRLDFNKIKNPKYRQAFTDAMMKRPRITFGYLG